MSDWTAKPYHPTMQIFDTVQNTRVQIIVNDALAEKTIFRTRKEPTRGESYGAAKGVMGRMADRDGGFNPNAAGRNKRSVWTITTKPYSGAHFAVFPPELPELCIKAGCPENGTVLDPFGGSGTTGAVAQQLGRNAILIEINPQYAELAKRRIYTSPMWQEVA